LITAEPEIDEPRQARGSVFAQSEYSRPTSSGADPWTWIFGIGLGFLFGAAIALARTTRLQGDETYHFAQLHLFLRGDFRVFHEYLTTLPGYHAVVAAAMWVAGADSLAAARTINAMFALAAAAAFHNIRRLLWPGTETVATAQFLLLPILAPFFFLVYTDVLAIALLLWALYLALSERHRWSATALLALVFVRQHEIVWTPFIALLMAWPNLRAHLSMSWPDRVARFPIAKIWPYAAPIIAFCVFWALNGSISLSHEQAQLHPLTFRSGNPCFALALGAALLPLQTLAGTATFLRALRARPWLALIPLIVIAVFWWTFHADNPYNLFGPEIYPRNALLLKIDHEWQWRLGATVLAALAACALTVTRLRPASALLLAPFALMALAPSWLIDQRYAMVPLILWLALREHRGRAVEFATIALWLPFAVYLTLAIVQGRISP
jgi:alpha-1,2-glucosyltransferase